MIKKFRVMGLWVGTLLLIAMNIGSLLAQDAEFQPARIVNDEGGPVVIRGDVTYTNPFFTSGVAAPIIILEDQAGFVDRNEYFIFPPQSQTIGQLTSDFYTSPFSYNLALPIEPQGSLRDVDQDGGEDTGVMVFAVAYWNNTWGDPFLEVRDLGGGGWSTAYASTRVSTDPDTPREIVGGSYLVYTPDDQQGFPSGFGADGLLFTGDDPIVGLPQGYTVVSMDSEPFTFDRGREQTINLIEPEGAELVDFSGLSFSAAFDAMLDKFRREYAFTEYKGIDWEALGVEFRPRFVEAEANNDSQAYLDALREFIWRIPDGHVSVNPFSVYQDEYQFDIANGLGLAIRETDDGRAIVTYLTVGGPAEEAGIQLRAEILEINGKAINQVIDAVQPWSGPFSSPHNLRLAQERFVFRFNADTDSVDITYRNPDENEAQNVTLNTVPEGDSFNNFLPGNQLTGYELPVEYQILPSGYIYASIYSFLDNDVLSIQLWERMIREINQTGAPGLIIDMRQNGGGNGFLADQMAAYFFDEELVVGQRGFYNEELDDFYFDERGVQRMYPPAADLRFEGSIAVLVGPECASACERFAYNLTLQDRAAIVGQYPTAGLGGSVSDFRMPLGITIRMTKGRSVDAEGNIHIEGTGVEPTVDVPVDETTLFSTGDPVLEAAIASLGGDSTSNSQEAETIAIGDMVTGEFTIGQRIRYTFEVEANRAFDVFLGDESGELTTIVRFYDLQDNLILSNEDEQSADSGNSFLEQISSSQDATVVIEIGTFEDSLEGSFILSITESE